MPVQRLHNRRKAVKAHVVAFPDSLQQHPEESAASSSQRSTPRRIGGLGEEKCKRIEELKKAGGACWRCHKLKITVSLLFIFSACGHVEDAISPDSSLSKQGKSIPTRHTGCGKVPARWVRHYQGPHDIWDLLADCRTSKFKLRICGCGLDAKPTCTEFPDVSSETSGNIAVDFLLQWNELREPDQGHDYTECPFMFYE
ncbi:hypothetical protein FH972_022008 [Carpinus fangiana]|uniref:Uncharacterized protein n=1 Tax=Carpinus fangiana TaxID=176857 RepID=A0A5N6KQZ6_9ROSI|nr:hypothetical protein FH972_022008 [Carpinus fangiana]